ncbi:helix-turn-helix domain-containing protein [Haloferax larsenii]|uniref:Helix-turn-helix domain-containing protein n=1 Tax=Haloferax larsenii TaxID=302484 RepID=A0ABY5RF39_HALLR|nr:helix-turn-helix domain-containing protein [Haloferax larsenii]ELZ80351.1 DNA binding domain-containing protein [Haloferax larsenii JCM 13917]UVE50982.1 helix-turn-helix domain-containing protein [Haloferax larsenii]
MGADAGTGYEVELGFSLDGVHLGSILAETDDLQIQFVGGIPTSSEPVPYFVALGSDAPLVDECLDTHPGVERFELIAADSNERLYRCWWRSEEENVISTIRDFDGIVRRMEGTKDGWTLSIFFPTNERTAEFHDACRARGLDIDVKRVEPSHVDRRRLHRRTLSNKQLDALQLAFERGYFETPKEASLSEIAAELGISEQALSQRLRRATRHVVESLLASEPTSQVGSD